MRVFQHEGEEFLGFQCENQQEAEIVNRFLRKNIGKMGFINDCNDPAGGYYIAISIHPKEEIEP